MTDQSLPPSLADMVRDDSRRESLIADCVRLIECRIANRGGLKGVTLRTGVGLIKSIKPDAVPRAVRSLLPDFAAALDPLYQQFRTAAHGDFSVFLSQHGDTAAQALLSVADRRAERIVHGGVKSAYKRLRGSVDAELRAALPELGRVLEMRLDG